MTFQPQTPQSPCRFSPATSSDVMMGTTSASILSTTTTLPTPAHSVNGSNLQQLDSSVVVEDSPHKRKHPVDDGGERSRKKLHRDDRRLGIDDLHLNVGEKYLVCQTRHPPSFPVTSEDLFTTFNLTDLAAEVAREKPNGEKNALRKTYKGHIKRLGVAGHFDVQKKDDASGFMAMLQMPELEWQVHHVNNRDMANGLSQNSTSNLARAMTMSKGPVPKGIWDSSILGDLTPTAADASKATAGLEAPTAAAAASADPGTPTRLKLSAPSGHDPTRPRRNIKKRSYGDSSFEGYGEGFPDDEAAAGTSFTTAAEGDVMPKRRKKSSERSPPVTVPHQQSYGPGMVGA